MAELEGARVLVVGASSGIGRASAERLVQAGARVAVAARRVERLDELGRAAPEQVVPLRCDVREPADCERVAQAAVEALGGLDALVYCAGVGEPIALADADAHAWRETLGTNLVGAALVMRAALPALRESGGRALFFSAPAAHEIPPRPGLALYAASKGALERIVDAWRWECPQVSFTCIVPGDTATEFSARWEPERAAAFLQAWSDGGYATTPLRADEVAARVVALLADDDPPETLTLKAPATRG